MSDPQRLTACQHGPGVTRDLAPSPAPCASLPHVKAKITARRAGLLQDLEHALELCPELHHAGRPLADDLPLSPRDGGVIRPGYHADLDELREIARGGKD